MIGSMRSIIADLFRLGAKLLRHLEERAARAESLLAHAVAERDAAWRELVADLYMQCCLPMVGGPTHRDELLARAREAAK